MAEQTEEQLLQQIGMELLATGAAASYSHVPAKFELRKGLAEDTPGYPADEPPAILPNPVTHARKFLSARYDQIHNALCADSERRRTLLASDEATLVTLIADILPALALGVPVITLATLLARIGLRRLCESNPFGAA